MNDGIGGIGQIAPARESMKMNATKPTVYCIRRGFNWCQFDKVTHRCPNCDRWQRGFKPKADPATDGRCECQVCENRQMSDNAGTLVLHGYTRPGYGWIVGRCYGVAAAPFPATDRLEAWESAVVESIASNAARLADLRAGAVAELTVMIQVLKLDHGNRKTYGRSYYGAKTEAAFQTVKKGDADRVVRQEYADTFDGIRANGKVAINEVYVPSWDEALDEEVVRVVANGKQMVAELARVRARIAKGRALRAAKLAPFVGVRTVLVTVPRAVAS